jgi:hypothetical protein
VARAPHGRAAPPRLRAWRQNELAILEFIHALVETLDRYFENVCELDIMFNLEKAHFVLDEMVMNGCILEVRRAACCRADTVLSRAHRPLQPGVLPVMCRLGDRRVAREAYKPAQLRTRTRRLRTDQ